MPVLEDYNAFSGNYWETGSIHNYYAYRGITAPHTNAPYSEALLMGISGGVAMGYFSFAYKGYDPHTRILTRNTFDPTPRLLERLGVIQHIRQTALPEKAEQNLIDTLNGGEPAIVWADMYSLPYNALPYDEGMWAMLPVVVYGVDKEHDTVWIADRARVPLTVTAGQLANARARVKNIRHRILTLDPPNPDKLPYAVKKGIWDCVELYTEKPPKGSKNHFGFAAFEHWAKLLTQPKTKQSWEKEFPAGRKFYAGLTSVFSDIAVFGKTHGAERSVYADFLNEASLILNKPALKKVAQKFVESAAAWRALEAILLPDNVPLFKETRDLMLRRGRLFVEQGGAALNAMKQIDDRLDVIKATMDSDFPLLHSDVTAHRERIAAQVIGIRDLERDTVASLEEAMA
jgi:hypothetical protein